VEGVQSPSQGLGGPPPPPSLSGRYNCHILTQMAVLCLKMCPLKAENRTYCTVLTEKDVTELEVPKGDRKWGNEANDDDFK
jgi:hypothetical protein